MISWAASGGKRECSSSEGLSDLAVAIMNSGIGVGGDGESEAEGRTSEIFEQESITSRIQGRLTAPFKAVFSELSP